MTRPLLCLLLLLAGCGGSELDALQQIAYDIGEQPLASGLAGSCLPGRYIMEYQADSTFFSHLSWAIGAIVEVHAYWPNRHDCHPDCPFVDAVFTPLGSAWTILYTSPKPNRAFSVDLRATQEGEGGFKTAVRGKEFDPPVKLNVAAASSIRFERSLDSRYADVIPGAIAEIHAARGSDNVIFTATLRDAAGDHVCGAIPATVTVSPPGLFSVEWLRDSPYLNLPYRIIAGNAPGRGTFEVQSGDLRAALTVIVD